MLTDDAGRDQVLLSLLVAAIVIAISLVRDVLRRRAPADPAGSADPAKDALNT